MYTARFKGHQAKVYDRRPYRPCYRITWRQGGQRISRERTRFTSARQVAEDAVRQLAAGNCTRPSRQELAALKTAQFALEELGVPLSHAVAEYVAAKRLVPSHPLSEAAQHWAKDHARAPSVMFIQVAGEFLTQQHQALSERSYREEKIRVGRLQSVLDVNMDDLSKSHIERFFSGVLTDHSGKTRNHYRQTLRQLLLLAVRKDYLPREHRLGEVLVNERTYEAAPSITIYFGNLHGFCGILPNFGHRCFEFG